jgi:hypothetical protein
MFGTFDKLLSSTNRQQAVRDKEKRRVPLVGRSQRGAVISSTLATVLVCGLADMAFNYRDPKTNLFRDAALDRRAESEAAPATAEDWSAVRKTHPLTQVLSATRRWFDALPASARPVEMMKTYPRIANRIAFAWRDPQTAQVVLDDLLIDHRGEREGFPPFVMMELMRLRAVVDGGHTLQVRT